MNNFKDFFYSESTKFNIWKNLGKIKKQKKNKKKTNKLSTFA